MRISDWSSDVCSSDLNGDALFYDAVDGARPVETAGPALGARASVRGRRRASTGKRKRQLVPILWIDELWHRHGLPGVAQRASRSTDHNVNGFCGLGSHQPTTNAIALAPDTGVRCGVVAGVGDCGPGDPLGFVSVLERR